MQQLYSSVDGAEVRSGLAKVISLAVFESPRKRRRGARLVVMLLVIGRRRLDDAGLMIKGYAALRD
jgi:hypothetical protein